MLNTSQLCNINNGVKAPLLLAAGGDTIQAATAGFQGFSRKHVGLTSRQGKNGTIKAESKSQETSTEVTPRRGMAFYVLVFVQKRFDGLLSKHVGANGGPYTAEDNSVGERLNLQLVATDAPSSAAGTFYATKVEEYDDFAVYRGGGILTLFFGTIGAIFVENEHYKEMYIQNISLHGVSVNPIEFTCNSWVHSKLENPQRRIFFSDQLTLLPLQTPPYLRPLRDTELRNLRGNGQGERKKSDRIYDYDVYNDLGDPDADPELKRPVLVGPERPYPRRCRTGRPPTVTDPLSESRVEENYVPRDEKFSEVKQISFSANIVYAVLESLLPTLDGAVPGASFNFFTAIDTLFDEGVKIPNPPCGNRTLKDVLPQLVKPIQGNDEEAILRFDTPAAFFSDRFGWLKDEEFGRQTLAGLNPCSIQLVTEWPLRSNLDPSIYGPPESALTTELVERQIGGFITVQEALRQKKLFIIDYHDAFLPYVNKVRELGEGTTMYGTRTLFCLMPDGTLKPVAIELTRPPSTDGSKPQWKQVYTPTGASTNGWLWKFAKAHAIANDSGFHQLVTHWLRTHCCSESYVIATYRQLSEMHPIHRLLRPHFRYTLEINAIGRVTLISAGSTTETSFNPGKYSMEISSQIYKGWRFDKESLPEDLISRGMAIEDPSAPHGLRLTIEDYPYASDGLLIWDAIKQWVTEYVNHYYFSPSTVQSDYELQAWYAEIRNRGHEDKKDEPWWPVLSTPEDLIGILTTMIWVASAHHAAVNFGQYAYAGYFPNRPTIARKKMPTEDPTEEEWRLFVEKPEVALLQSFPAQLQATRVMAVLYVLSTHSPDEEYLGQKPEPSWLHVPAIKAAYERFHRSIQEIERIIEARNANSELKNRCGAGVVPYELLKPYSAPGVTSKGVPNSISI